MLDGLTQYRCVLGNNLEFEKLEPVIIISYYGLITCQSGRFSLLVDVNQHASNFHWTGYSVFFSGYGNVFFL
jgi:hypothetical protein